MPVPFGRIRVFLWTLGFVGAPKLDILVCEEHLIALPFLTRLPGAALLGRSELQHALVGQGAKFLTFWTRRFRGVAGSAVVPCPASV